MTRIKSIYAKGFKSFAKPTELKFSEAYSTIIGPNGSGKSLSYDSVVTLSDGNEIKIGELVESKLKNSNIKTLKDGVYCDGDETSIISVNPTTMKAEGLKVSKFTKREGEKLFKITTRSGRDVKATGCHPIMVFKDNKLRSVLLRDVKENDLIATPRKLIINSGNKFDKDKARLLGYLIGDGVLNQKIVRFTNQDKEVLDDVIKIMKDKFGLDSKKKHYKPNKKILDLFWYDKNLFNWIKQLFSIPLNSGNKFVPNEILKGDLDTIANFLSGLLDTDGSVRKDVGTIEFCSKSEKLTKQVQRLLLRFGVLSKVKVRMNCASNTVNKTKRPYYYLYIFGHENIKKFYINIPLKCRHKKEALEYLVSQKKISNPNVDLLPRGTNKLVKKAVNLLGLKVKLLRKEYPKLAAYVEDRCSPSRDGLNEILPLFSDKLFEIYASGLKLEKDQFGLVNVMDSLALSGRQTSSAIGMHKQQIRDVWATGKYQAKQENLEAFHGFIKESIKVRVEELKQVMNTLNYLANSDIYWDKIEKVERTEEEKYVYDLTVEGNHNFVSDGIFVHNSNVVDLITFVLGKGSAKAMRASKSVNLIFNGGKSKTGAKEAVGTIIFDNKEKEFPTEEKEVKFTRTIKQSGLSKYEVNGNKVTRQEFVDMLNTAGVDPDGHNIILQGDIIHFTEMRPLERRQILEEVAGISVYDDKKNKSLRELDKVELKLNEADIILKERGNYLKEIKNDRDQALRYKEVQDEIKRDKFSLVNLQLKAKEDVKEEVEKRIKVSEDDRIKNQNKIDELKKKVEEDQQKIKDLNSEISEKGEKDQVKLHNEIEDLKAETIKKESRITILENEVNRVNERKGQLRKDNSDTEVRVTDLDKQITTLKKSYEENSKQLKKVEGELDNFKKTHKIGDDNSDEKQDELIKLKEDRQVLLREHDKLKYQLDELNRKLEGLDKVDDKDLRLRFKEVTVKLSKSLNDDARYASSLGNMRRDLVEKEEDLAKLNIKNFSSNDKISASRAVDGIISAKINGVYDTISKLGEADGRYALALEVAAGARILSIVTKDERVAASCIGHLKKNRLGVATFLPLNKLVGRGNVKVNLNQKGVIGSAIDLVKYDPQFKAAFEFVFGNTLIVEDIEIARSVGIGKVRMVTLEGDLMETSGAMVGGHRKSLGVSFKEKGLQDNIAKLENEIDKSKDEVKVLENNRVTNEEDISSLRREKGELEAEISKIEREFGDVDISKLKNERDEVNTKADDYDMKIKVLTDKIDVLEKEVNEIRNKKQKFNVSGKDKLDELENKRVELKELLIKSSSEINSFEGQKSTILRPEMDKIKSILVGQDREINDFEEELEQVKEEIKVKKEELKLKEKKEKEFYSQYKSLFSQRDKLQNLMQKSEQQLIREEERIRLIETRLNNANIDLAKIKAEITTVEDEIKEFTEDIKVKRSVSIDSMKTEIVSLERELIKMGNVNMRALEVYNEIFEEFEALKEKAEKLRTEKRDVLNLIEEIESKKKGLFMKTYSVIAKDFQRIFSSLTTKGQASLELDDEENPLEENNGVEIRVKLNTNKYLDIKSLSGGEKTLAALSLIFAIQEYMPASFYLLDEVDAALDKRNSELLSNLIAQYSSKAQYIVISHNDSIISEADSVYGVSMQEGISKVVSLKL
jgi:chromosome segregation protein